MVSVKTLPSRLGLGLAALLTGGCSFTYLDDDGSRHVVGLVNLTIEPPQDRTAGEIVRVQTLGISALSIQDTVGFTLGYQDLQLASLKDHALAVGPITLE